MDRDKKFLFRYPDFVVRSQAAAGNDAVHMDVVIQLLIPGMEDLDDAGRSTKELFIGREFQKSFGTAFMEEAVKELLVTTEKGIQFMGQGKDNMEVRGIDDFGTALIHPDFFLDSLAVWTVTVTAGIIVQFCMAAVRADGYIAAELTGFTV